MKRVAVIGAGTAGLCVARHLLRVNIQPVIFEQRDCIGGQWAYEDVDRNNQKEVFSSMYDNLRTNQPIQVMEFPNVNYPDGLPSYVHHTVVLNYIKDYAKYHDLLKYTQLQCNVKNITPLITHDDADDQFGGRKGFVKWKILYESNKKSYAETFDGVLVANGHFSVPAYPNIPGFKNFKGKSLHSHYYRRPSDFQHCNALILGNGPSGNDIMLEMARTCNKIYFSHRGMKCASKLPENVVELPAIHHVSEDGQFVLENMTSAKVDVFIPCTGYDFDFPFLSKNSGIQYDRRVVNNLFKHLFNATFPSMAFIGIPWTIAVFPFFDKQSAYVAKVFAGGVELPSITERIKDTQRERIERQKLNQPDRYFHQMFERQFPYMDDIARITGEPKHSKVVENLYLFNHEQRDTNLQGYRNANYEKMNDEDFVGTNTGNVVSQKFA